MAIKRYNADADNTISNAFKADLTTRGTGANMGGADVLEVFSIRGQASGSSSGLSSELTRAIIQFPISQIQTDRSASVIPLSGSVSFYLKMFNAPHTQTVPKDMYLMAHAITKTWEEGTGLDMEQYTDLTYGKAGSTWTNAATGEKASSTFGGAAALEDDNGTTLVIVNADETSVTFTTNSSQTETQSTATTIGTSGVDSTAKAAQSLHVAFAAAIAAGTLKMTLTPSTYTNETTITLTQTSTGDIGNTTITVPANITAQGAATGQDGAFTGGSGVWTNLGGDFYSDQTTAAAATAEITVTDAGALVDGETFAIIDTSGTSHTFTIETGDDLVANNKVGVQTAKGASNETAAALQFALAINDATSTCVNTISAEHGGAAVTTLTQKVPGILGTRTNTDGAAGVTIGNFTGGAGNPNKFYKISFEDGTENLEHDITPLVEMWANDVGNIYGGIQNYGLILKLTGTQEAFNEDTATFAVPNPSGALDSFYTKKFFSRSSEFFFNRPVIEARWNSSDPDDRGNFYYSSSLAPAEDNLNTLFLYNYVRGQLRDIPEIGATGSIMVSLFSGNVDDTAPSGSRLELSIGGGVSLAAATFATGGHYDTGIYTCSLAITSAATPIETLYDVWSSGTIDDGDHYKKRFHTGSITPESLFSSNTNPNNQYALAVTNLRPKYSRRETARFRLYARQKEWNPTIYTKATADIETEIIESASYMIYRVTDDLEVIPHNTGSDMATLLSFDISGNYFDLDMSMLESDYAYGLRFAFYNGAIGSWVEQSDEFKFRVEDQQT